MRVPSKEDFTRLQNDIQIGTLQMRCVYNQSFGNIHKTIFTRNFQ